MKRIIILLAVALIFISSCSERSCPTYSRDQKMIERREMKQKTCPSYF